MNRVEAGAKPFRQLHRVVIGPEMDKERARLVVEHMVVNCSDLDPVVPQGLD